MNILFVANYSEQGGGISVQVRLLQKKLTEDGIGCVIISTKGGVWKKLEAVWSLLQYGKKYEVFHVHACSGWGFIPAVIGIAIGRRLHRRVVLTYHGGGADRFFQKRKRLVTHFLFRTDSNIVLSGFIGGIFDRYHIPYTIIPNIIELNSECFVCREALEPKFIGIRSFTETYNLECTLRAFKTVSQRYPSAHLTLLGDGPLRNRLESFVHENHIPNVFFLGRLGNEEIYSHLSQADIMLSSSLFDNMPVSILEGFNAGLLVIASNVGGIPYMIENGVNGLLFQSGDDQEMARKMVWAIEHPLESLMIVRRAYEGLSTYSWANIKIRLLPLYSN